MRTITQTPGRLTPHAGHYSGPLNKEIKKHAPVLSGVFSATPKDVKS